MKMIGFFASTVGLGLLASMLPLAAAQNAAPAAEGVYNHAEVGVYGDYLRFAPNSSQINFVGVGGRVGINTSAHWALEGEINYDFARNYTTTYTTSTSSTTTTTFVTTGLRPLTGLFGPKLQFGSSGPMRAFVTGKVGFVNFSESNPNNVSTGTFSNAVGGVGGPGTHVAFYPGGGLEAFAGPFGLRAEVGDEIYLDNGTYNNLEVTFGPVIRF